MGRLRRRRRPRPRRGLRGRDGLLYRNDGGALTAQATALPGYLEDSTYSGSYDLRSLAWADADNDGDLDLLVPSVYDEESFEYSTRLLRNDGPDGAGGWLFADANAALDPTVHAQSAWADDDGDGDLDLLLVNVDPYTETGFVRRYGNQGGAFTGSDLLGIRLDHGQADWGDADADGDLDLLVAGNIQEADETFDTVLRVYRNEGGGYAEITLIDAASADWLDLLAASWADYDSDGDVDLLVTGNFVGPEEIEGRSEIFANDGGSFAPLGVALPAPIDSIGRGGTFTWFDLDGDGDLDYLVAGAYFVPGGNGLVEARMHLYRNGVLASNSAPTAPSDLTAVPTLAGAILEWSPATDDHTPAQALTYDLEVRRAGAPAADAERLPEPGNVSAVTSWSLDGLETGLYTWRVTAVDSAFQRRRRRRGHLLGRRPLRRRLRVRRHQRLGPDGAVERCPSVRPEGLARGVHQARRRRPRVAGFVVLDQPEAQGVAGPGAAPGGVFAEEPAVVIVGASNSRRASSM